ncbi:hypothetical protein PR048_015971 [Dryococelus australis]|uniref:Tc1-like transposase DDE domain-containing protein n=1 Tax=Dryococelus australis TaxID=614101 RepID=A0ABQ9HIF0_9NEOP|nr:hypothetical protein PR048_015971 [Dryococelus australis]
MVWDAIGCDMRPRLLHAQVNLNTNRYTKEVLEPEVLLLLQQDNVRPHVARNVQAFFNERRVPRLPWPARSPDILPIEHVWDMVCRVCDRVKQRTSQDVQLFPARKSMTLYCPLPVLLCTAWDVLMAPYGGRTVSRRVRGDLQRRAVAISLSELYASVLERIAFLGLSLLECSGHYTSLSQCNSGRGTLSASCAKTAKRRVPASVARRSDVCLLRTSVQWRVRLTGGTPARLPQRRTGFYPRPGHSLDFRMWPSCRTMPPVGGFSRGFPLSRPFIPLLLRTHLNHSCRFSWLRCYEPPKYLHSLTLEQDEQSMSIEYRFLARTPDVAPHTELRETTLRTVLDTSLHALGFPHVGIVPCDAAGPRIFSGGFSAPSSLPSAAPTFSPRFVVIGSRNLNVKSRPIFFTYSCAFASNANPLFATPSHATYHWEVCSSRQDERSARRVAVVVDPASITAQWSGDVSLMTL